MTEWWNVVAAVAAGVSAIFAAISAWFTFRLIQSQEAPKVVVYTCPDPNRQTLILIRIANIGHDVATEITFIADRPIPELAIGLSEGTSPDSSEVMKEGPLIEGIPVLGPGDARDVTWGQVGGLLKATGRRPIELTFTYRHGRKTFRGSSQLEVKSFIGTDASAKPQEAAARSLDEISTSLGKIAAMLKRLERTTDDHPPRV
jgi:hypothetical protein